MDNKNNNIETENLKDVLVDVKLLKPGFQYAHPLYDEYNNLILDAHTPINKSLIQHLSNSGIEFLYYDQPETNKEEDKNEAGLNLDKNVIDEELNQKVVENTQNLFEEVREIFNYSPSSGVPKGIIDKSRNLVNTIVEEINKNDDAIFTPFTKLKSMDQYIYQHSTNVSILGALVGSRLDANSEIHSAMGMGGLFHDIGKSSLSEDIVNKVKKLSGEELDLIKEHPHVGYKLIEKNPHMKELEKRILLLHHERSDGEGYPFGFSSDHYTENIPKEVRLMSICNVFINLIFTRPEEIPLTSRQALRQMLNMVHAPYKTISHFIQSDFRDFIRATGFMLNRGNFFISRGDLVRTNTGEIALVEELNKIYPLKPKILLLRDSQMKPLKRQITVDLLKDFTGYISNIIERKKPEKNRRSPNE
ncbi:HD-GYP domain-containing protein [Spirochaetota bacterium]